MRYCRVGVPGAASLHGAINLAGQCLHFFPLVVPPLPSEISNLRQLDARECSSSTFIIAFFVPCTLQGGCEGSSRERRQKPCSKSA